MNLNFNSSSRLRAMVFLWGYALFKFWIASEILITFGINPWIFLFLDTITVPSYIIGWNFLIASLGNKQNKDTPTFKALVLWGMITFVSSTVPYFYAAWAGKRSGSKQVWIIFALIMIVLLISQIRKLKSAAQPDITQKRVLWFTDTLTDLNGISITLGRFRKKIIKKN